MATTLIIAALTAVVALVGSLVTWMISKRNASGAIDTSVAADLWAEGGKIRGELRTDLADTKAALTAAAAAVTELKDEIRLSREETAAAREESRLSREETREMKAHITSLTAQISELHRTQIEALNEVKTGNTLTIGGMADNAESRRIMEVPKAARTSHEADHLDTATDRLPSDLAADQTQDKEKP
jgi:sRNA-binding protein